MSAGASDPEPERLRAFFAVGLPDGHRQALAGYLAHCAGLTPAFRWVEPASLHLTLRFLGSVEESQRRRLAEAAAGLRLPSFELRLGAPGRFGPARRARVAWLGVQGDLGALETLAYALEAVAVAAGLRPETRPYRPHLTLARARAGGAALPDLPSPPDLPALTVDSFQLYRSQLGAGGARYAVLDSFMLAGT